MSFGRIVTALIICVGCTKQEPANPPSVPPPRPPAATTPPGGVAAKPGATVGDISRAAGDTRTRIESEAPDVVGGGGNLVPPGFVTTFTGPAGPTKIAYTQLSGMSGAEIIGKGAGASTGMRFTLQAVDKRIPFNLPASELAAAQKARTRLEVTIVDPGATSVGDLGGKVFTAAGAGARFEMFALGLSGSRAHMRDGRVAITSSTAEAIEGTFSGDFYDGPMMPHLPGMPKMAMPPGKLLFKITDGKFRAYPAQVVTKEMLEGAKKGPPR